MTSISCEALAREVLCRAIAGDPPPELPRELIDEPCQKALFGILVEGLSDRFDPRLCDIYAQLLAPMVGANLERYFRAREVRPVREEPARVMVLSRVTLGADIAVTSVMLAAAKQRFPRAEICFAGPGKNCELFAGDPRVVCTPVEYRRGSLADRLSVVDELRRLADDPQTLVIDPDSRLTQLGLLEICPESRYRFFESRSYGAETGLALPELAARWAEEILGVAGAKPFIAMAPHREEAPYITVSLGVGENPAKRISDPFEDELLAMLAATGFPLWIDRGAGGEESERVTRAAERASVTARFWEGSFAGFAAIIAGSCLYVGYDSAGQHAASACEVPLISIFAGFPSQRMFERWRPVGEYSAVVRVDRAKPAEVLRQVKVKLESWQTLSKLANG